MRHTFTISGFSRDVTPSILVSITYDGVTGYGEGGLPPYMIGQTHETVQKFLSKVDMSQFSDPFRLDDILTYVDRIEEGFTCAKSAIDIALHDLIGKLLGVPIWQWFGYTASKSPNTSYTIGIDTEEVVRQKTKEAAPYNLVKVKLGIDEVTDKKLIETVRSVTGKPLLVDANQGWKTKESALDMIHWLSECGVLMIEQPMPKTVFDDMAWITERSPLPTFADESCQRLRDVPRLHGVFNGINIKLIKCSGLYEARKMIAAAEALGMKTMVGCTTETSCAVSAAAQLSPQMDFADLDGNLLIANDRFDGMKIVDGKITLNDRPGIGVVPLKTEN
ncbi:MAG: dipeptide epimerase [Planctomycetaceae bacterium]|nr:dipeptide epimerase [Planctomycetaceae bacterium]